jgi:hypothetical protein
MVPETKIAYTRALTVNVASADQSMYVDAGFPHASAFLVGTAGVLKIDTPGGDIGVLVNVVAGWNPVSASKVYKTNTTASGVTALY